MDRPLCFFRYTETIDMIYSENTFDFTHVDPLIDLPRTVLPSRLCMIRSLRLKWVLWFPLEQQAPRWLAAPPNFHWPPPPYDYSTWTKACKAMTHMHGLQKIFLTLTTLSDCHHASLYERCFCLGKAKVLHPLCEIRGAAIFEITVDWYTRVASVPNAPFTILYSSESESGAGPV